MSLDPRLDGSWFDRKIFLVPLAGAVSVVALLAAGVVDDTAALTLSGVILTACVALAGHIVTFQSGRRSAREHAEEEARLRLDAAMRAGALFNGDVDRAADPAALASGLLALTQLGRTTLAVALLVDLWDSPIDPVVCEGPARSPGKVSDETAILVIDAALTSGDASAEIVAAELLCRNSGHLDIQQSLHWPSSVDGAWNPAFGMKTKLLLVDALLVMALRSTPKPEALRSLAVRLYGVFDGDPDPHVKGCLGMLVDAIVPALRALDAGTFMWRSKELELEQFVDAAAEKQPSPDRILAEFARRRSAELEAWSLTCSGAGVAASPPPPGALAGCDARRADDHG